MRARYSARSTYRASQERLSAVRESIEPIARSSSSIQHPRVLGPAALAGIDHERAFLQRHPGQAPWHDANAIAPGQHERAQIDVARRNAFLDAGRAGRERERRLRDEILRVRFELGAERRNRRLVGHRPDQHAIAARAVYLLDHDLLEMLEHVA